MSEIADPRYRVVQLRIPVFSRGAALAAVVGLLVLGGLAWGGYHVYQVNAQNAQARAEMDAAARELSAREGARLDAAEENLKALEQTVDKGAAADSSDAVNVNGYLDSQGRLRTAFSQVGPDLDSFYARPHASFLSSDRRRELDALRQRADAGTGEVTALDARIQQAAQHRQKLAQAEAAAAKAAAAKAAAARRAQAQAEADAAPDAVPAATTYYYDSSPYPYGYYGYPYSYGGPSIWIGGRWGGGHGWHGGHHH